jgi:hypothetical protein
VPADYAQECLRLIMPILTCVCASQAGGDIYRANLTLAAASSWCAGNKSCAGYTAKSNACSLPRPIPPSMTMDFYFKNHSHANTDPSWSNWLDSNAPSTIATGPPAGIVLPSGRVVVEFYTMGGYASALLSDDGGQHFRPSRNIIRHGGEGAIALGKGATALDTVQVQRLHCANCPLRPCSRHLHRLSITPTDY